MACAASFQASQGVCSSQHSSGNVPGFCLQKDQTQRLSVALCVLFDLTGPRIFLNRTCTVSKAPEAPSAQTTTIAFHRTDETRFQTLPGYPWAPRYLSALPSLGGLRIHYLDEGPRDAPVTWLCLHGNPTWSYVYRRMIPVFVAAGHRVVAPDLPGFGRSDKPIDEAQHRFGWHRQVLLEFVSHLDLQCVQLVVQDWGGLLGLTIPMADPVRYQGLLVMNTWLATAEQALPEGFRQWRAMCRSRPDFGIGRLLARGNPHLSADECVAYDAPFPDQRFRAATRAFPERVPEHPDDDGVAVSREAARFWAHDWAGWSMMAVGTQDPVFTTAVMETLRLGIRGCSPPMRVEQGGHFVQEHGGPIALEAIRRKSSAVG
jgi:pimeloyl-ACP methyl ester carboxylesterase